MTRVRMGNFETSGYLCRYRLRKPKTKPTRKASHEDVFYFNQYDASQRPREEYSKEYEFFVTVFTEVENIIKMIIYTRADISESSGVNLEIDGKIFDQYPEEEDDDDINMQDLNAKTCDEASQNMGSFNGAHGPYFPNFTATMLFIWVTKHMISTAAYEDLVQILQHEDFVINDTVPNIRRLLIYHAGSFITCQRQVESRSQNFVARIRSIVTFNEEFCFKVDELVRYSRIPGHLHSAARENVQNKALWLVEGFPLILRKEDVRETSVWLSDNPEPTEYNFIVNEILYRFNYSWKIRGIFKRHKLPNEHIIDVQHPPPPNVPIRKFFLDIYLDDFGTYRNVYHTLGVSIYNWKHAI
ncbi:3369_t:CDS:2 [Paraglomus occultum]|uniref:3369_t:CDS:1 n=1 Tax=Paraglomus occultum TaxID=144539 RepID=A0A9N9AXP9_9GLOM|nr:3369_t:CDS:2 [Paraglomus occultum]